MAGNEDGDVALSDSLAQATQQVLVLADASLSGDSSANGELKKALTSVKASLPQCPQGPARFHLLYCASIGMFSLGQLREARRCARELTSSQPGNAKAIQLLEDIEAEIEKDGTIGLAIVGGIAVAATAIGVVVSKLRR